MYISRGNDCLQDKAMLVAGCMGLIGKLPLVVSFHKQAAVRIGYAPSYSTQLLLLPPRQLFLRSIVPPLLCWSARLIIIKRFLPMSLPVLVYLFHQFLGIVPGCRRNLYLHLFLVIGVGLDVCTVYKYRLGRKITGLRYLLQNPTEYLLYCLLGKPVPEIITHRGKVRSFLLQGIAQEPAVGYI